MCREMHLFCHDNPETVTLETDVADARPGRVALAQSPFYPGGGGQLADRGLVRWASGEARVTGFEFSEGKLWHLLDMAGEVAGGVLVPGAPRPPRVLRPRPPHTPPLQP